VLLRITFGRLRELFEGAVQIAGFEMVPGLFQEHSSALMLPRITQMLTQQARGVGALAGLTK